MFFRVFFFSECRRISRTKSLGTAALGKMYLESCFSFAMNCSTPGSSVLHCLLEFAQTHVHWIGDTIQPSHPLLSPSPPTFNLSQHQGLFQWVSSLHQVAKALKLQFQHQSFQCIFRTDFLCDWLVWSPCCNVLYFLTNASYTGILLPPKWFKNFPHTKF